MKKNLAIVGYGGQGAWHANWAMKSDVVSLAGIYDIAEKRVKAAIDNGIKVYSSLEDLVSDESVDIVLCATPNDVHKDIVITALNAKKHVICEKPVALSVEDFDDMVKAAEDNGVLFTVHQNRRWDVDYLAIQSIIDSGEIGETVNIESRVHGSRGIPSDWRCHKQYGGGMILDWGVHLIDQMLGIAFDRKIEKVYCRCDHLLNTEVHVGFRVFRHRQVYGPRFRARRCRTSGEGAAQRPVSLAGHRRLRALRGVGCTCRQMILPLRRRFGSEKTVSRVCSVIRSRRVRRRRHEGVSERRFRRSPEVRQTE